MTKYLTIEQVLIIHDSQIERYGGSHGIRELSLLESAVFRPQTTFSGDDLYPTIFEKASVLFHSLVLNHAFVDGNKRTATASTIIFLRINGYLLEVKSKELIECALKIASKEWNLEKIANWLEENSIN